MNESQEIRVRGGGGGVGGFRRNRRRDSGMIRVSKEDWGGFRLVSKGFLWALFNQG